MVSHEQQFAEKLHAYTRPRGDSDNSRVKDLLDLVLLMRTQMEPHRLRENIERTFSHRVTHPVPLELAPPPEPWRPRSSELAAESGLEMDADSALRNVAGYVRGPPALVGSIDRHRNVRGILRARRSYGPSTDLLTRALSALESALAELA
jgi:hypothetical protein